MRGSHLTPKKDRVYFRPTWPQNEQDLGCCMSSQQVYDQANKGNYVLA